MRINLVLRNGTIVDGTGAPGYAGDVLISDGVIAGVGEVTAPEDAEIIDCSGLTVSPGFIDSHSHSDLQVLQERPEKVLQGVTSEVVGNCGFSAFPTGSHAGEVMQFADGIFCGDGPWGWPTARAYLAEAAASPAVNVGALLGHGTLRVAVAGTRLGPLTVSELDRMERLLAEALQDGATGLSTGLMYAPGSSAPFEELERLCLVLARHGKIYTTHMRSYAAGLVAAVEEQIELARRTGCRLQISHLQAVGSKNWPLQQEALDRIEAARRDGVDVMFDCYPYPAGSTVLTQVLPDWALDGGIPGLMGRLGRSDERRRISAEIEASRPWGWDAVYISAVGSDRNREAVGRNIAQISAGRGIEGSEAVLDLLLEEQGKVNMLCFNQSDANLRQTISHPLSIVISDGFYVKGRPHPRLHGTFPKLLGTVVREWKWLSLEEAVRKISDAPARRFGFEKRGRVEAGYHADLAVFDAAAIDSPATYERPEQAPMGIRYVLRDGRLSDSNAQHGRD